MSAIAIASAPLQVVNDCVDHGAQVLGTLPNRTLAAELIHSARTVQSAYAHEALCSMLQSPQTRHAGADAKVSCQLASSITFVCLTHPGLGNSLTA
jgi:hypothetical protein